MSVDTNPKIASANFTTANTLGWDTVFGIRFGDVNQAIVNAGSSPASFTYDDPGVEKINGVFSDWTVTGGSGQLLQKTLPVDALFFAFGADPDTERRQVAIQIEVQLDQIPQPAANVKAKRGSVVEFRIKGSNILGDPGTVLTVSYPALPPDGGFPGQPASIADGLTPDDIGLLFSNWINFQAAPGEYTNLQEFNHAFAAVNLNSRAATDAFAWLAPTAVAYGVSADGAGNGILAILCMTENRAKPVQQDVASELLPNGARAGFLISKRMYMANMLMPGLALMFDDPKKPGTVWPDDYFEITGNGTRITNTAALGIEEFEINGKTNPASIQPRQFQADLEDNWLTINLDRFMHPFWKGWYDVYHDIRMDAHIGLSEDKKQLVLIPGSGEVDPDGNDLNPPTHYATVEKTDLAKGVEWAILAVDVLLLLVTVGVIYKSATAAVATETTDAALQGAAKVTIKVGEATATNSVAIARGGTEIVSGSIAGVTRAQDTAMRVLTSVYYGALAGFGGLSALGLLENVMQEIINSGDDPKDTIPDVGVFANMVMEPITWPGSSGFDLTSAAFNGGVQMGGDPTFAD